MKGAIYEKIKLCWGGGNLLSSSSKVFTLAEGTTCVAMSNGYRKAAFTLAEVLVTLGIIGVVSAMTVPSLMQNYQRQSYLTQLHKVYNEMQQALVQYQTDTNAVNLTEAGLTSNVKLRSFIKSYFKVIKECEELEGCFASDYKNLNGGSANFAKLKSFVLASGASIRPTLSAGNSDINVYFAVDVNGPKGPNILGRDCFFIFVFNNGMIDDNGTSAPLSRDEREKLFDEHCFGNGTTGCFGRILNDNWEMTY